MIFDINRIGDHDYLVIIEYENKKNSIEMMGWDEMIKTVEDYKSGMTGMVGVKVYSSIPISS